MTGRRLLLALAVMGLVTAGFTGVVAADASMSITGVSLPSSVSQGDSFDLTVTVSGQELQSDEVDVSLTLPDGLSCSPSGTQTATLSGGTGDVTFDCNADSEGDYTGEITVTASAVDVNDGSSLSASTQTGLEVLSPATLTLTTSLSEGTIDATNTTTLTAVVQNNGDASTSYTFSKTLPSGVSASVASGSTSGTVSGGSTASIQYTVTGNSAGQHDVTVDTSGGNGQSLSETETVEVQAPDLSLSTSVGSSTIDEGSSTTLSVTTQNNGNESTGYTVSVSPPSGVSSSVSSGSASGTVAASGSASVDYTLTGDSAGDHSVQVTVTDDNGATDSETVSLSVEETSSGGGGGGLSSSFDAKVSTPVSTSSGTSATIEKVTTVDPTVTVPLDGETAGALSVTEVSATFNEGSVLDNTLSVEAMGTPPSSASTATGDVVVGYLDVTVEGDLSDNVESGSFTVSIDRSELTSMGADPSSVTAVHYDGGEWVPVETRHMGNDSYEVTTSGFSTFALTADQAAASTATPTATATPDDTDTATPTATATPDDTATATAAETDGDESAETDTAESGATATSSDQSTATATGGNVTGTVAPTTTETTESTPGEDGPGFGVVAALLAVLVVALRGRH